MKRKAKTINLRADVLGLLIAWIFMVFGHDPAPFKNELLRLNDGGNVSISQDKEIKMAAVGDIMLSRQVAQKMKSEKDYSYPFLKMNDILKGKDIVFGNLEGPVIAGRMITDEEMVFRADPETAPALKSAGFDILSIANNHTMNFGKDGLESTIKLLDENGILHAGGGLSDGEINRPAIMETKGVKFAFLAYTYNSDRHKSNSGFYGLARMDTERMQSDVKKAGTQADVVIVSMHAGTEYEKSPNQKQKDFAHAAIDAGASLVLGHHPHVVQTAEKYKDGYIAYSLGNFVFDQMWSNETRLGAVAEVTFRDKKITEITFVPVKIYNYSQPQVIGGNEADDIINRLKF